MYSSSYVQEHITRLSVGLSLGSSKRESYEHFEKVLGFLDGHLFVQKESFYNQTALGAQQKGFSQSLIFTDATGTVLGEGNKENTRYNYGTLEHFWIRIWQ
tara:strand:- start:165 stop:467 length:303 start_codon:yes stop_codon:yes gene_type:complete